MKGVDERRLVGVELQKLKLNRNQVLQILRSYNILQLFCCSVVFLPHEGDVERPLAAFGC